jgi:NAD(P)-dependent dehydrogenase (short-subunit alcohol dehydrogenase family)
MCLCACEACGCWDCAPDERAHTLADTASCVQNSLAQWYTQDLSTEAGCKALAADVASREPALHILVNNSGTTWGEPLATYPDVGERAGRARRRTHARFTRRVSCRLDSYAAWDRVFAVNLKAPFTLTRACLPMLDKVWRARGQLPCRTNARCPAAGVHVR